MNKTRSFMVGIFAVVAVASLGSGVAVASDPPAVTVEECERYGGEAVRDDGTIIAPGDDWNYARCEGGHWDGKPIAR
ncbi:hypothetical protein AB0I35_16240 [Nocardia sp. NPDC050378]|uniref:hypothetical protein n=1 Tax=Nocardia sp. NPDC050378 TaxID=3155400 RepID=UPI0034084354